MTQLGGSQGLYSPPPRLALGNPLPSKAAQRPAGAQGLGATLPPARGFRGDKKSLQHSCTGPGQSQAHTQCRLASAS